jgi:hypothetical protein
LHASLHNQNAPTYLTTLTSTINLVRAQNYPPPRPLHRKSNKEKTIPIFVINFWTTSDSFPIPLSSLSLHKQQQTLLETVNLSSSRSSLLLLLLLLLLKFTAPHMSQQRQRWGSSRSKTTD